MSYIFVIIIYPNFLPTPRRSSHFKPEACSIGTGTAGLFGRATLVRPCKRTTWQQFYRTRNLLFAPARVAHPNRPAVPVPMLHASDKTHTQSSRYHTGIDMVPIVEETLTSGECFCVNNFNFKYEYMKFKELRDLLFFK